MTTDILIVTGEIIEIFKKHELSRVQSTFVLKAAEMQIQEEITRELIAEQRKGYDGSNAGIQ